MKVEVKQGDESSDDSAEGALEVGALEVGALVDAHPVATLLGALGVGYILGGGLFTSLTRRLVGTGLRLGFQLAVLPSLEREVAGMAGELGKALGNRGESKDDPTRE